MITSSLLRAIETELGRRLKKTPHIQRVSPLSGGSINQCARIQSTAGTFFLKLNDAFQYPLMFEKESNGLKHLKSATTLTVPETILTGEADGSAFLILSFIESKARLDNFWERFGTELAIMHRHASARFGFEEDNYIGSLKQSNTEHGQWVDFFVVERIERQLRLALNGGKLEKTDSDKFTKLFAACESMFPIEPPSFIHGDLWSGNFMTGSNGEPCLIDPAVYFGHREMDLAMSKLFGGFDPKFYEAYENEYPLSPGFDERVEVLNLYPLLVHVNLFGGGYVSDVRRILKRFS